MVRNQLPAQAVSKHLKIQRSSILRPLRDDWEGEGVASLSIDRRAVVDREPVPRELNGKNRYRLRRGIFWRRGYRNFITGARSIHRLPKIPPITSNNKPPR